jgi:glycosyltransferase involved in cell wall biosynthesis
MPLFSVIIPTFNRKMLLTKTMNSVFDQNFSDFEVIVVDDGSTDGTADYVDSVGERARLIRQVSRGPGAARNVGAKYASGVYLAFLDSDDLWFPWTLEVYREVIERHSRPAFLAGKPHNFSHYEELESVKPESLKIESFEDYLASGDQWRWWGVSSFVIRREVFVGVGGFIEDRVNSEDADLALRLGLAPGFVQITAPATFAYRVHAENVKDNLGRTLAGIQCALMAEKNERYPGGTARAKERRQILTRHIRPVALECLRVGRQGEAWNLYASTFAWNLSLGRLRYLCGFPLVALAEFGRRKLLS